MTSPSKLSGAARLDHLGVIRAEGADAAAFLHGQLTQDVASLGAGEARLAALCTAKGRMLASFVLLRPENETVLLVCSRDLLAATLKRLTMFVLRAKVRLSDVTADLDLHGLAGAALAANGIDPASRPGLRLAMGGNDGAGSAVLLHPADGVPRALWIARAGFAPPQGEPLDPAVWRWGEVRSGIVTLTTPVVEAFVPQMLNYESVGAVNFKKGCYPGQEIVARSQFRGTLKRRTYLAHSDTAAAAAGQEVFAQAAGDAAPEPVGTVAQAALAPEGGSALLVSMQIAAADAPELRIGAADGPTLSLEALPYELLADV
ncbi:MAG: folate-binding protein [Comamonadaceae bacterium]|nr:MAG: folate-binding protein [Comamonadaceae bacterium]